MEGTKGTEALQPWSNIRLWSDSDAQPLDALVASVKEAQEVVPLVERFRRPGTSQDIRGYPGTGNMGKTMGKSWENFDEI